MSSTAATATQIGNSSVSTKDTGVTIPSTESTALVQPNQRGKAPARLDVSSRGQALPLDGSAASATDAERALPIARASYRDP